MYLSPCQQGQTCTAIWVQKTWCNTNSKCSSVCLCSTFVASLVFFVLMLVHQEQLLWHVLLPIQIMWPAQQSWAFSSITLIEVHLAWSRTLRLVICPVIGYPGWNGVLAYGGSLAAWCDSSSKSRTHSHRAEMWGHSSVDFQLCGQGYVMVCEHPVVESSKSLSCLTDPHRDFLFELYITWDHASKILEALNSPQLCATDIDGGLRGTAVGSWLEKNPSFQD